MGELWGALLAGLIALLLAGPIGALASDAVPRHPQTEPSAAEGFYGVWRFVALSGGGSGAGGGAGESAAGGPQGLDLMVGEHGQMWSVAARPLIDAIGPERAYLVVWCSLVLLGAGFARALARAFDGPSWTATAVGATWAALPAFAERGMLGLGGLGSPTIPAAALGMVWCLSAGDGRPARALGGGCLAGLCLAGSLDVGPSTALGTLVAATLGALHLAAVPRRAATPGIIGLCSVILAGVLMFWSAGRAEDRIDAAVDDNLALPMLVVLESERPRPAVDWSPLATVSRFLEVPDLGAADREGGEAVPPEWARLSFTTPAPAPVLPIAILIGLVFGLLAAPLRGVSVGALLLTVGAASFGGGALGPALWGPGTLWAVLIASRAWGTRIRGRWRFALPALLLLELWQQPVAHAPMPQTVVARRIADSPVAGQVVELPFRAGVGAHHARAWNHRRTTPLPILPASARAALPELKVLAPTLVEAATDTRIEDAESLAAELDWLGAGHLLVDLGEVDGAFVEALDRLPGWERAPRGAEGGGVAWWYRARDLWSAVDPGR